MSDSKNQIQSASFVVPVLKLREPDPADVYTFLKNKAESAPNLFSGAPIIVDISELSDLPDLLRIKDAVGRTGFLLVGFTGIKNEADRAQFATLNIPVLSASAGSASRPQHRRGRIPRGYLFPPARRRTRRIRSRDEPRYFRKSR